MPNKNNNAKATMITSEDYSGPSSSDEDEETLEGHSGPLLKGFRQEIEHIFGENSSAGDSKYFENSTATNAIKPKSLFPKREQILEESWTKFSAKHGFSPLNLNNNLQSKPNGGLQPKFNEDGPISESDLGLIQKTKHSEFSSRTRRPEIAFMKLRLIMERVLKILFLSLRLICRTLKILGASILALFVLYCIFILHKPTQRFISRNTQDLIYPLMRGLRLVSIPVVRRFPFLTDYYEEACLIPNPYYEIAELECWPCESVRHVVDLTGFSNFSGAYHHSGIPFVVKDAFSTEIGMEKIRQIVSKNSDVLGKSFVETSHFGVTTLENVIGVHYSEAFNSDDFHMKWYINRVVIARLWKHYFQKPYFIPKTTEVSVQHFLFVDRPLSKTYRMPLTEFANVFLTQASGSRSIVLIPTKNCQKECKVVSAVLKPKDVLFYNWLFWRPMSVAADSTAFQSTSVTFIGSFY